VQQSIVLDGSGSVRRIQSEKEFQGVDPSTLPLCKMVTHAPLCAIVATTHVRVQDLLSSKQKRQDRLEAYSSSDTIAGVECRFVDGHKKNRLYL